MSINTVICFCVVSSVTKDAGMKVLTLLSVCCVGMGCFWGAEKKFWQRAGVMSTQVNVQQSGIVFVHFSCTEM